MKCIYCLEDKSESSYQSTDHVIPQLFGRFQNNLTLHEIVCDECNEYFGNNIELYLGRDSLEGIARYNYGIRSDGEPHYERVSMQAGDVGNIKGVHVVLKDTSADEEAEVEMLSQVGFFHSDRQEYDYFVEEEIPDKEELERLGYQLDNKEIVFYGEIEHLVEVLKKKGMNNIELGEIKEEIQGMPRGKIPVMVKARIDRIIYRGLSKIVFNYLAYNMGRDFVLSDNFNGIRNFIRHDQGDGDDFFKITTNPILHTEKRARRRLTGHIIAINWENNNNDLVGRLSLYNAQVGLTHMVRLCRNYRGVWVQIQYGHYFNPASRTIRELYHTNLTLP